VRRILLLAVLLSACAAPHAQNGALRISATHYESMAGVTLKDADVPTTCTRQMITGSHIPRWYCRIGDQPDQYALDRHIVLVLR